MDGFMYAFSILVFIIGYLTGTTVTRVQWHRSNVEVQDAIRKAADEFARETERLEREGKQP